MPITARPSPDGVPQHGSRLVLKNRAPSRDREMQVLVNPIGRTTLYAEIAYAKTGARTATSENIVGIFGAQGALTGLRLHHDLQVPDSMRTRADTAAMRALARRSAKDVVRTPLEPGELQRVQQLAAWLRKRCPV